MSPFLSNTLWIILQILQVTLALPAEQQVLKQEKHSDKSILEVRHELKKAEIIPTVINDFLPSLTLTVSWPSNKTAKLGNTIDPDDVQDTPTIELQDDTTSTVSKASGLTYTITLTDPDAPSRDNPEWSEMCHWIATKVPLSSDTHSLKKNKLKEVMPYKPPGPPPKTGKHRYVFLVFTPANSTTKKLHLSKPDDRQHWGTGKERHGVRDWAEENGLVAVAANFIYSQNEKQ